MLDVSYTLPMEVLSAPTGQKNIVIYINTRLLPCIRIVVNIHIFALINFICFTVRIRVFSSLTNFCRKKFLKFYCHLPAE